MFRVRILLAAVLAASALAVLAVPAGASVPAANAKFCNAASKIGSDASNASGFSKAKAQKLVSQFKKAAKYAPAKVKSAIGNITKLLGAIAGTTDASDLSKVYTSDSFKKYPAAITTFVKYQTTACAGS
jgi:hypothetical protein